MKAVLYAEDDPNDALFMTKAWKKVGVTHSLRVVPDGQKAVDYLAGQGEFANRSEHPLPSMLLLDLNLPCLHGFDVLRWIREQKSLRTLLVVVFSASTADRDAHRAYDLGANSYVIKPSNPDELREFVTLIDQYWLRWNFAPPDCADMDKIVGIFQSTASIASVPPPKPSEGATA